MEDLIPKWFWKLVAVCTAGGTFTLVTSAWSLGAFMSETQTWQRAQDQRFIAHLEVSNTLHAEMVEAIRDVRGTVTDNGKYGAAFNARIEDLSRRLDSLEESTGE